MWQVGGGWNTWQAGRHHDNCEQVWSGQWNRRMECEVALFHSIFRAVGRNGSVLVHFVSTSL